MNKPQKSSDGEIENEIGEKLSIGMRFELDDKNKLKKKETGDDDIEVFGEKSFKFKKNDFIVIDALFEEDVPNNITQKMQRVKFHVERDGKRVRDDKTKDIKEFTFSKIIFIQRFRKISDMQNVVDNVTIAVREIVKGSE